MDTICDEDVQVGVQVESRSKSLSHAHYTCLRFSGIWYTSTVGIELLNLIGDNLMDRREQSFVSVEPIAHWKGECENELAIRNLREYIIYQVSSGFGHPLAYASRAESPFFARKCRDFFFITLPACETQKTVSKNTAF